MSWEGVRGVPSPTARHPSTAGAGGLVLALRRLAERLLRRRRYRCDNHLGRGDVAAKRQTDGAGLVGALAVVAHQFLDQRTAWEQARVARAAAARVVGDKVLGRPAIGHSTLVVGALHHVREHEQVIRVVVNRRRIGQSHVLHAVGRHARVGLARRKVGDERGVVVGVAVELRKPALAPPQRAARDLARLAAPPARLRLHRLAVIEATVAAVPRHVVVVRRTVAPLRLGARRRGVARVRVGDAVLDKDLQGRLGELAALEGDGALLDLLVQRVDRRVELPRSQGRACGGLLVWARWWDGWEGSRCQAEPSASL